MGYWRAAEIQEYVGTLLQRSHSNCVSMTSVKVHMLCALTHLCQQNWLFLACVCVCVKGRESVHVAERKEIVCTGACRRMACV